MVERQLQFLDPRPVSLILYCLPSQPPIEAEKHQFSASRWRWWAPELAKSPQVFYAAMARPKAQTSISRPQLDNTIVFSIGPGARAQEVHRDDMIHHNPPTVITADQYKIGRDTSIGWFEASKKTTRANGAAHPREPSLGSNEAPK
ncbi:hypothetical protein QBC40DRAFT_346295 [Triangularia verruculosa]|uniref:Uncharacterized protein n=1 Tax=Triangularia verruculosa TaxID=2587418 RepID=A0AAN6XPN7_9PEZI|nr:hypothetical protein QBC40DRAFT_346295 [Triangularia verruculosa]